MTKSESIEKLAMFYLRKNNNFMSAAQQEVESLGIESVVVVSGDVIITLRRPGRLIGPKGRNIEELGIYFGSTKIKIVESTSESDSEKILVKIADIGFTEDNSY